jgi:hypothetical protein
MAYKKFYDTGPWGLHSETKWICNIRKVDKLHTEEVFLQGILIKGKGSVWLTSLSRQVIL